MFQRMSVETQNLLVFIILDRMDCSTKNRKVMKFKISDALPRVLFKEVNKFLKDIYLGMKMGAHKNLLDFLKFNDS